MVGDRVSKSLKNYVLFKKFERYFGLYIVTHEAYLLNVSVLNSLNVYHIG